MALPVALEPGSGCTVGTAVLEDVAAGADGLIIEVHNDPEHAWSDGAQSLKPAKFAQVVEKCRAVARAVGREM